jgi:exodeoxyribonuclease VII large subunit
MNLFEQNLEKECRGEDQKIFSVSEYLDSVNSLLKAQKARIIGEVFGVQEYPGRSYMYYSVKDKADQSTIKCFMWKRDYDLSGVKLEEGLEVILNAYPAVYKPNGGLSLQVSSIELVGEGALKIAYEKLKAELQKEGLFDESRKREIPEFPKRIGIITSKSGAVINDFLSNIGKYGFQLLFVDSKVEGDGATRDLLSALRILYQEKVDCLVMMRGGGSLESFQAFNNENIVRAVSKFNAPVVTGIGHDKDLPLVSLVSDKNVSTPTAVANLLSHGFVSAKGEVSLCEQKVLSGFANTLKDKSYFIEESSRIIETNFRNVFNRFDSLKNNFLNYVKNINENIVRQTEDLNVFHHRIFSSFNSVFSFQKEAVLNFTKTLEAFSPEKRLKQGYSIVRFNGKVLKSKALVKKGDDLELEVSDGIIKSEVI